jgi:membrane protease YdiL (CAAX protease family)
MNVKITIQFLLVTFAITIVAAAGMFILSFQGFDIHWSDLRMFPVMVLYALSPAIASYLILKRNGKVSGLREWLKNVFYFKTSIFHYLLILFMLALFFVPNIFAVGLPEVVPIYMIMFLIPIMLIGGGMEEAGWRYILQPELAKRFGFFLAAVITGFIWYVWHLPLFFMPGTDQAEAMHLIGSMFTMIGMSFFFGAIIIVAKRAAIFLSILLHTMNNAINNALTFPQTETEIINEPTLIGVLLNSIIIAFLMFAISAVIILVHKQLEKRRTKQKTKSI